tara:strand:- start:13 stop:477 length:465 start_codon:yes stop_codon:yes gene_type:complete
MAITNNTDFSAGAILTAQQQNNFPRGIMALRTRTSNSGILSVETVTIAAITFTAVANRNYRITYYEPQGVGAVGTTYSDVAIKNGTTTAGTLISLGVNNATNTARSSSIVQWVGTFSAGAQNIVATGGPVAGTINFTAGATFPAFLMVEDLGTA